jgi:cbb3-type cytochrome oxidase maturation protein
VESLYLLIPVALVFCAVAIRLLLWAIDSGQYEDLDKESWRILNDEEDAESTRRAVRSGSGSTEDEAP